MQYFIKCGTTLTTRYYGPFASISVLNLWLESHAPTKSYNSEDFCDEGVKRHNHKICFLNDPMKGISRHAEVDVTHALTGK